MNSNTIENEMTLVKNLYELEIHVQTKYLEQQSAPEKNNYLFSYTITIINTGQLPARLVSRHWMIANANNEITEVTGEGVVGEQPLIPPGDLYQYTSGAIIDTPVGTMEGSYQMIASDGQFFEAQISPFALAVPKALH